ncbi:hypothetical protein [Polaromonas sp.]|uniref:hypothetical protein n=1 Tax=Polaromonas sp. TaxID=1869339 RepID=UPI003BB78654
MRTRAACENSRAENQGAAASKSLKQAESKPVSAMTRTKNCLYLQTYTQKLWYSFSRLSQGGASHYQTHSKRKSLIHKETLNCLFPGQLKQSLDLQGSAASCNKLSTKLSTENLDNSKTVKNQGLSDRPGCAFRNLRPFWQCP